MIAAAMAAGAFCVALMSPRCAVACIEVPVSIAGGTVSIRP